VSTCNFYAFFYLSFYLQVEFLMVGYFGGRCVEIDEGFGAEQLLGLAGTEVTEGIDWDGG
jgi:hypothetical protein